MYVGRQVVGVVVGICRVPEVSKDNLTVSAFFVAVKVTRLIRTAYGDYQLQTIPPGMAIEVPVKPVHKQKHRGPLWKPKPENLKIRDGDEEKPLPVQWIKRY